MSPVEKALLSSRAELQAALERSLARCAALERSAHLAAEMLYDVLRQTSEHRTETLIEQAIDLLEEHGKP